jgi:Nucleotidyltransferase domain
MINCFENIDSIVVFGSVARNKVDYLSDRDILIISNDTEALSKAGKKLDSLGWSTTKYTWTRLNKSATKQLLFIQHLKQESIIFKDKGNKFSNLLYTFSAKNNYKDETEEAIKLLSILNLIPNSTQGRYWALDILMVGLRSLAIPTLANEGIYCFSFQDILQQLCKLDILSDEDVNKLSKLREFKTRYRRGIHCKSLNWNEVFYLINIVDKKFRVGLDCKLAEPWQNLEQIKNKYNYNWYINSRILESALMSLSPQSSFEDEANIEKYNLQKLIKSPGDYAWAFSSKWGDIKERFSALTTICELKN